MDTIVTRTWNPDAQVEALLFVDAIDASLYQSIEKFGKIIPADRGQLLVVLSGEYVYSNTILLPDRTEIDIVRSHGLVHLQDWHNHIEFDD